jgi:two-component system, OmpR family, alkaline phosphatase synthesis response regulator PhoP
VDRHKILLIDNDLSVQESVSETLSKAGFDLTAESSAEAGIKTAAEIKPKLILIDILLPGMDGVEACIELRKKQKLHKSVIAFYTSRTEDYSQIAAFNAGADDYIIKPVSPRVLIHRIRALLRRFYADYKTPELHVHTGDLKLDRDKYILYKKGEEIFLPRKEFELLSLLSSVPEKVFSRSEILSKVWGYEYETSNRTIDVHIRKLREKVGNRYILTVKGIGYRFNPKQF